MVENRSIPRDRWGNSPKEIERLIGDYPSQRPQFSEVPAVPY